MVEWEVTWRGTIQTGKWLREKRSVGRWQEEELGRMMKVLL